MRSRRTARSGPLDLGTWHAGTLLHTVDASRYRIPQITASLTARLNSFILCTGLLQQRTQLTGFVQLYSRVAATDELSVDVNLWDRWPG